jgi:amidase
MVAEAMQRLGHDTVDWKPTVGHGDILKTTFKTWLYDGGRDVRKALELSGEPLVPQVAVFANERPQYDATGIMEVNVEKREIQKQYMEYWNSTDVDCIISPVAPYPAARKGLYKYVGYTTWVNLLDYTSVVIPVTTASKELDPVDQGYAPMNDDDKAAFEACKLSR